MKQGHRDNGFVFNNNGRVIAVSLGVDYCAEHEWGIPGIKRECGIIDEKIPSFDTSADSVFGLDRRRVTKTPADLRWYVGSVEGRNRKKTEYEGFWLPSWNKEEKPSEITFSREQTLWTGWTDRDFGAFSTKPEEVVALREIFDALKSDQPDAAIWLGGGGVFVNAGLVIGISSRLDPMVIAAWEKADRNAWEIKQEVKKTGIEDRLRMAKRSYFALSPSHDKDGTLMFWLNPCDQHLHNSGYFTVKDLDAWIVGMGPVMKKKAGR